MGCRGVESVSRFGVEVSRPGLSTLRSRSRCWKCESLTEAGCTSAGMLSRLSVKLPPPKFSRSHSGAASFLLCVGGRVSSQAVPKRKSPDAGCRGERPPLPPQGDHWHPLAINWLIVFQLRSAIPSHPKQTRRKANGKEKNVQETTTIERDKERKKTDNPREGWEGGTPPPHRDFKERSVMR